MKNTRIISLSVLLLGTMLACSSVSTLLATSTPVPTPTPRPTSTPVPTPTSEVSLLEESVFSPTGCFNFNSTKDVKRYEKDGQLHMEVLTPGLVAWTLCDNQTFTDFVIEADVSQVEGVKDNGYGMVLRYSNDNDQYYAFAISGDGYYVFALDGLKMDSPEILLKWTQSKAINQNQVNHLKAVVVGEKFRLFVNDQFLAEIKDSRLGTGSIGFFALSSDAGSTHVSFDNLRVSKP